MGYAKNQERRGLTLSVDAFGGESVNREIGARMKAARAEIGHTQASFAAASGGSRPGIQDNETGKTMPGGKVLYGFVRAGINVNWLLTGEGPMTLSESAEERAAREASGAFPVPPGVMAQVSGQFQSSGGKSENEPPLQHLVAAGDSMLPTLRSGWSVRYDPTRTAVAAGLYVVKLGGSLLVRRLEARPGGGVRVSADNPAYQAYDLNPDALAGHGLEILGAVVWAGGPIE